MTIALLLIGSLVLMATMLVLTVGVNELERKTLELSGLIKRRYVLRNAPKKKPTAGAPAAGPGSPPAAPGGGGGPAKKP